ncbi:ABC transporter substrate-binding protein [Cellulomonas endophytica]|uniref:ABC transporter substrate-binding protein n=1 Tax=Cellulomonas endophytica TaxID=2494735 RepID=UPI001F0C0F86|nr:extracellular solute-binding protein [Cellulomonas endophytica]
MTPIRRTPRRTMLLLATGTVAALGVAACSGPADGGSASAGAEAEEFKFLVNTENTTIPDLLTSLSEGACSEQEAALPLSVETVPQTQLDQRLQLLAGQDALPAMYAAGNSPALTKELAENGQVLDFEQALADLGKEDAVLPAARSTIEALYGGFNVLPFQYNIEGIWYNETLFADNGIEPPATWDELVAAAQTLKDAGVVPFAASGEQGWPITRLISGYLFRDLGPDALQKVADGEAELTDPEYVAAAQAVADLGAAGFFSEGVGSIDYDTAFNQFTSGDAGMFYMGSWALSTFADPEANPIGADAVGFMPFPAVEGGAGDVDAYPSNVGLPMTFSAKAYGAGVDDWLGCLADSYGDASLTEANTISGFASTAQIEDPLAQQVQDTIAASDSSVLWFEALFGTQATTTSQTNAAQLLTGAISAEEFMSLVQADLDAE